MIGAIVAALAGFFRSRLDLSLELLALRQQVAEPTGSGVLALLSRSVDVAAARKALACVSAKIAKEGDRDARGRGPIRVCRVNL